MKSFLQRYYEQVKYLVGDPNSSVRLDTSYLYQRVHEVDRQIFELLVSASGQEDTMSYAEALIAIQNNRQFYPLPDGFRRFLGFSLFDESGSLLNTLPSRHHYSPDAGVEILSPHQGFRLTPSPLLDADENWTLKYVRGPGLLHYAKAKEIDGNLLVGSIPEQDAGSLIRKNDYYNGLTINLFSPDDSAEGVPQTAVIKDFRWRDKTPVFQMRTNWEPTSGDVWYEILPCVPYPYDSVYAIHTAREVLVSRRQFELATALITHYQQAWQAAKQYMTSEVADRAPERVISRGVLDLMPSGEVPYA